MDLVLMRFSRLLGRHPVIRMRLIWLSDWAGYIAWVFGFLYPVRHFFIAVHSAPLNRKSSGSLRHNPINCKRGT